MPLFYNGHGDMREYVAPNTEVKRTPWALICHRGVAGFPQNTIPAVYGILAHGYNHCEVDVRMTNDEKLVLCHDATITGTDASGASKTLTISDSTLEEIQALALSTSEPYGNITAPTLDAVLELAAFTGITLILDIKDNSVAASEAVARTVLQHSMQGKVQYNAQSNIANAQSIVAIDPTAKFHITAFSEEMASVVGGDTGRLYYTVAANTTDLAAVTATAKSTGCSLYLWGVGDSTYTACADLFPVAVEFSSGHEVRESTKTAISDYIQNKSFW